MKYSASMPRSLKIVARYSNLLRQLCRQDPVDSWPQHTSPSYESEYSSAVWLMSEVSDISMNHFITKGEEAK